MSLQYIDLNAAIKTLNSHDTDNDYVVVNWHTIVCDLMEKKVSTEEIVNTIKNRVTINREIIRILLLSEYSELPVHMFDEFFRIAWERGHSAGVLEVVYEFNDYSNVIEEMIVLYHQLCDI